MLNVWNLVLCVLGAVHSATGWTCDPTSNTGTDDDTSILQKLLDDPSCSEIALRRGQTFFVSTLFIRRSDFTLTIDGRLAGLPASFRRLRPDCTMEDGLEFAWTHWCAMLQVQAVRNVTLRGSGTVAPGGVGGTTPDFYSALHVQSTVGVTLAGLQVTCTAWWWCTVLHNVSQLHVSRLFVDGSTGRDGMDLVNCRHVLIEDSRIEGSDDALCFKTIKNGGLSAFASYNVSVRRCSVGSTWCNAVQFGSASEVAMSDFRFESLNVTSARKAGLSIVSMDGANIRRVAFSNVVIASPEVATPLYVKLGNRAACEDGKGSCWLPGSISDVNLTNISAVGWGHVSHPKPGHARSYTATIEGLNATHRVGPVRIDGLHLITPGGGTADDARVDPPISPLDYQPRYDGTRPASGLFIRYSRAVAIARSSVAVVDAASEGRPAVVIDHAVSVDVIGLQVLRGGVPCQIEARNCTGCELGGHARSCAWTPDLVG